MTDQETAHHIRNYVSSGPHGVFSWPTDDCGYDQHIKFVNHRNENWEGNTDKEFNQFLLDYANTLDGITNAH